MLVEFNKALRALNFYPPGHSALKPILKRAYEILMKYLYTQGTLPLQSKRRVFSSGMHPLEEALRSRDSQMNFS